MRRRFGLTCQELVELVTDYLEGALSRRDRTRFERHLSGCGACPAYLEQMRQTLALLGHLDEETLDPDSRRPLPGAQIRLIYFIDCQVRGRPTTAEDR